MFILFISIFFLQIRQIQDFSYYVRYGPDYNLISKEFQLIVEQKISTKFIVQFCFQLNKKTYALIVEYLKKHKDQKGQVQITYDDIWPPVIEDSQLRVQIQNIPTKILRTLNKDVSQAYHLLMESFSDSSLQKLFKYERIRDLYQFMTEIILNRKTKTRKEKKQKKDNVKDAVLKRNPTKNGKSNDKSTISYKNNQPIVESEWSILEQRYLCALYLERPLIKCCEKMREKFGENQKWDSSKKVYKKADEIFQKSLKKAFRSTQLKSIKQALIRFDTTKQNLISQIIKKKSCNIEKSVLRYFRTNDQVKKSKSLDEINSEMLILLQIPQIDKSQVIQKEEDLKVEQIIKQQIIDQRIKSDKQSIDIDKETQQLQKDNIIIQSSDIKVQQQNKIKVQQQ